MSPPRGGAPDTQRWAAVHRDLDTPAIDHLAVSGTLAAGAATVHRPHREDGSLLSDHAADTADLRAGALRPEPAAPEPARSCPDAPPGRALPRDPPVPLGSGW